MIQVCEGLNRAVSRRLVLHFRCRAEGGLSPAEILNWKNWSQLGFSWYQPSNPIVSIYFWVSRRHSGSGWPPSQWPAVCDFWAGWWSVPLVCCQLGQRIYSCVPEDRKLAMPPAGIVRGVAQAMAQIVGLQAQFLNIALMRIRTMGFNLQLVYMCSRAPLIIFAFFLSLSLSLVTSVSLVLPPSLPPSATFLITLPGEHFEASWG